VSLPLLVVFVVGIFDFSNAISLKQKLMNAAREGARVSASDPATDLATATVPVSIWDANWVVDRYLVSEQVNDCGLSGATPTQTAGTMQWVSTSTGTCTGSGISLTVDRGCKGQITSGPNTLNLIQTCITLSYPYQWEFNSVIGLLGGNTVNSNTLTAKAEALNEN
jgi:Flp pilus assembly protein TadG